MARLEGAYRLDLLVGRCVIVEEKAVEALSRLHEARLLTYMRLSFFNFVPLASLVSFVSPLHSFYTACPPGVPLIEARASPGGRWSRGSNPWEGAGQP
jgi:hypothetical protein